MSKKKIGLIVAGAAVLLIVIVIGIVIFRIDALVRSTIEKEATAQLDLNTTLDDADVGLLSGSVTLDDLAIANPEGYSASHIFELGQVNVDVSYSQLTSDPVRIGQININSPTLTIERSGQTLQDLANINLRDLLSRLDMSSDPDATKLIIDQLSVANARVIIRPGIPELDEEYAITIPDLQLNGIGNAQGAQNGAEIGRVAADLAMALTRKAAESEDLPPEVRAVLSGDLKGILNEYAGKLSERVQGELREQLGDLGGELGGTVGDAATRAIGGDLDGAVDDAARDIGDEARDRLNENLGGLLGGRKKEPTTQPR